MTDERQDLLVRRLVLVGEASSLTAEGLRLRVQFASAEMEVLRLQMDIGKAADSGCLGEELHRAEQNVEAIEARQGECDGRIAAVEADIEAIDQTLAAMDETGGGRT